MPGVGAVAAIHGARRARRTPSGSCSNNGASKGSSGMIDSFVGQASKAAAAASTVARKGLDAAKDARTAAGCAAQKGLEVAKVKLEGAKQMTGVRSIPTPARAGSKPVTQRTSPKAEVHVDHDTVQFLVGLGIEESYAEEALRAGISVNVLVETALACGSSQEQQQEKTTQQIHGDMNAANSQGTSAGSSGLYSAACSSCAATVPSMDDKSTDQRNHGELADYNEASALLPRCPPVAASTDAFAAEVEDCAEAEAVVDDRDTEELADFNRAYAQMPFRHLASVGTWVMQKPV